MAKIKSAPGMAVHHDRSGNASAVRKGMSQKRFNEVMGEIESADEKKQRRMIEKMIDSMVNGRRKK